MHTKCEYFFQLKGEYKTVKALRQMSGFGWNEGKQCVTAAADVWNAYIAVSASIQPLVIVLNHPLIGPSKGITLSQEGIP
jgi:hypothetical protein